MRIVHWSVGSSSHTCSSLFLAPSRCAFVIRTSSLVRSVGPSAAARRPPPPAHQTRASVEAGLAAARSSRAEKDPQAVARALTSVARAYEQPEDDDDVVLVSRTYPTSSPAPMGGDGGGRGRGSRAVQGQYQPLDAGPPPTSYPSSEHWAYAPAGDMNAASSGRLASPRFRGGRGCGRGPRWWHA